ncbi:MAG TPA: sugar ABC transporter permease [Aggregatilinea sp.]|uniref:carbohydrate ABC transporter permease n=1 Tax=Aggregatilinea sp. TaxID=2806333 RepID=UPI002C56C432|nr:sugar ABC transporter permease [Aggregatilinea sp.]HML20261.1 sugar ABC transporter permease [Aggregatilinea sp.]
MTAMARVRAGWQHANRRGDVSAAAMALAPAVILFAIFNIYPLIYSGYLSVMEWDGFSPDKSYVGLDNYRALYESATFRNALSVTLKYTLSVAVLGVAVSLVIAVLLNSGVRGQNIYRLVYFLPVVTSTVAAAVVWRYLMTPGTGYADVFLRDLGITPPNPTWLRNPTWALRIVMLVGIWKRLGFNIVIYLAGLQNIPKEFYEAATVDGAGIWARFRHITVPLISPITLLLVIMSIIDSFLIFDVVYVMTDGGPIGTTEVVGLLLYREAFRYFNLGTASAMGWVIFALVFAITLVQWKFFGTREAGL